MTVKQDEIKKGDDGSAPLEVVPTPMGFLADLESLAQAWANADSLSPRGLSGVVYDLSPGQRRRLRERVLFLRSIPEGQDG